MAPIKNQDNTKANRSDWRAVFGVTVLYVVGHFLLLLNRGFYWDGLYQSRMLLDNRLDVLWANLEPSRVYAYYFLLKLLSLSGHPIFLFKFTVFVSWFIAGVALYFILRKRLALPQGSCFFLTSSFLLIPTFLSRVELSTLPYSLSNMLFFLASLAYFSAERVGGSLRRKVGFTGALLLFFLSFFTYSLLVFYGGFLLFLLVDAYQKRDFSVPVFSWGLRWLQSNALFVLLPVFFWVFKLYLGAPYGPALHYNENDFIFLHAGFLSAFVNGLWQAVTFGFWAVVNPTSILQRKIFALVFLCSTLLAFFIGKKTLAGESKKKEDNSQGRSVDLSPSWYLISGSVLFFLGVLAYILVGKPPHVWGVMFATRHALLLPLGLSLILLGTTRALVLERWRFSVQAIFLGLFITFNIYNYWNFDMDWYRSLALTENLRHTTNQTILGASTLIFHDHLPNLRYFGRNMSADNYRTYVYEAFPGHFKFAVLSADVGTTSLKDDILAQYNVSKSWNILPFSAEFDPTAKPVHVVVTSGALVENMTVSEWLKLKRYELFADESTFLRTLADDLRLEVVPTEHPELLFD